MYCIFKEQQITMIFLSTLHCYALQYLVIIMCYETILDQLIHLLSHTQMTIYRLYQRQYTKPVLHYICDIFISS